jgi:uncharacterized protein (DUF697 family)
MSLAASETAFPLDVQLADSAAAVTRRYAYWSGGAGLIPVPLIDMVVVGGIQVKMVAELAKIYDTPFSETRAKAVIGALVGTIAPYGVASVVLGGMMAIPVIGTLANLTVGPALGFASTLAVGKVFSRHFSEGGTLLSFSAEKAREYYKHEFEAARKTAPSGAAIAEEAKKHK